MSVDKTIIQIPSIYFSQYVPNVASNFNQFTYNEGIYIDSKSANKTYPKSVVRVYKNKNYPKKIYLLSKDTTILDALSQAYSILPPSYTAKDVVNNVPIIERYLDVSVENLTKYSKFSQPSNFVSLDFNSIIGKTINFYCLNSSSIEKIGTNLNGEPSSEAPAASTRPGNYTDLEDSSQLLVSYYLKTKSLISDYINTPDSYTNEQINVFNGAFYYYWFDKEATINSVGTLTSNDLVLYNTYKIKKTKTIDFSQYVDKKYQNVWVQKIDSEVESSGAGQNYVIAEEDTSEAEDSSSRWFPLYSYIKGEEGEGTTTFSDGTEFDYLADKFIYIQKNDFTLTNQSYERELFSLSESRPFGLFERSIRGDSATGYFDYIGSLNRIQTSILDSQYELFIPDKSYINEYYGGDSVKSPLNYLQNSTNRIEQYTENFDRTRHLSNIYVLNSLYKEQRRELGQLFPDSPDNAIVYEIELEQEIEIDNGAFMVVEIE